MSSPSSKEWSWQSAIFGFLLCLLALLLARPLILTTSDLGRHIMNGKVFFTQGIIPDVNLYSYTQPDFPFVNHHWASGALFYLAYEAVGFTGLAVLAIAGNLATFFLMFEFASLRGRFDVAMLYSLLAIPLIATRIEVRPEIFSYLLVAVFLTFSWQWRQGTLKRGLEWLLPLLMVAWVNLHIYFFIGEIIVAAFVFEEWIRHRRGSTLNSALKTPLRVLGATLLATLINPSFIRGALAPILIFQNYQYPVSENQSVFLLESIMKDGVPVYFKMAVAITVFALVRSLLRWKEGKGAPWLTGWILAAVTTLFALAAIRHFSLFAFVSLPVVAVLLSDLPTNKILHDARYAGLCLLAGTVFVVSIQAHWWLSFPSRVGIGLPREIMSGIDFFRDHHLRGPIFNDYDIGGYLIFGLYPEFKVYTDNRPEAYPGSFFTNEYIRIQTDEAAWRQAEANYRFTTIIVSAMNRSTWTRNFLSRRLEDPTWKLVFSNAFTIIFVKDLPENADVIKRYTLPSSSVQFR